MFNCWNFSKSTPYTPFREALVDTQDPELLRVFQQHIMQYLWHHRDGNLRVHVKHCRLNIQTKIKSNIYVHRKFEKIIHHVLLNFKHKKNHKRTSATCFLSFDQFCTWKLYQMPIVVLEQYNRQAAKIKSYWLE
jgi:hypothetical protein